MVSRFGVIGNCEKNIKDFYLVPLPSHEPIHEVRPDVYTFVAAIRL